MDDERRHTQETNGFVVVGQMQTLSERVPGATNEHVPSAEGLRYARYKEKEIPIFQTAEGH